MLFLGSTFCEVENGSFSVGLGLGDLGFKLHDFKLETFCFVRVNCAFGFTVAAEEGMEIFHEVIVSRFSSGA